MRLENTLALPALLYSLFLSHSLCLSIPQTHRCEENSLDLVTVSCDCSSVGNLTWLMAACSLTSNNMEWDVWKDPLFAYVCVCKHLCASHKFIRRTSSTQLKILCVSAQQKRHTDTQHKMDYEPHKVIFVVLKKQCWCFPRWSSLSSVVDCFNY